MDDRVSAAACHRGLADGAGDCLAPVAQQVVPDGFQAVGRDGEGDADHRTAHAVAVVHQIRGSSDIPGGVVDALRRRGAAPGRIDLHLEGRIGFQHALVPDRQFVAVLVEVGGVDDEERLVAAVRVAVMLADDIAVWRRGDAAGPFRDGAVGVARPLAAEGREVVAEPRDLVGRDLRGGGVGERTHERERDPESKGRFIHGP